MRFLKICIFCIVFLALGITLVNVADLQKTNTNLNNQITQQEQTYSGKIDELTVYQEKLVERISLLEENYQKLQTAYDELKAAYDQYIQDSTLERETIQNTVVDLRETIAVLEQNADVDTETITALESEVIALETSLENQTTTANELQATVTQQEATIAELNTTIDTLIAELNSDLNQLDFYKGLMEGTVTEITAEDLDGVTAIRPFAFENMSGLTSVTLPDSCVSVGRCAFFYTNLSRFETGRISISFEGMTFRPENMEEFNFIINCSEVCLNGCFGYRAVIIDPKINIYYSGTVAEWCAQEASLETSECYPVYLYCAGNLVEHISSEDLDGVENIAEGAFKMCHSLQSVEFSETCKTIGETAFAYCSNLTTISISDSVKNIGSCAFYNCSKLETISLGNGVETIEVLAFNQCNAVTTIAIPSSVKFIGNRAFCSIVNLNSLYIPDLSAIDFGSIKSYATSIVSGCINVVIYTGSTKLPSNASSYWNSLSSTTYAPVNYGYTYEQFMEAISA